MASPNMLQLNSITGVSNSIALTTTSEIAIASNAAASNSVFKVNAIYACNAGGTTDTITLNWHNAAAIGGTAFPIDTTVSLPANSTIVLIDKDANLYLQENTSLGAISSVGSSNTYITITYELCV